MLLKRGNRSEEEEGLEDQQSENKPATAAERDAVRCTADCLLPQWFETYVVSDRPQLDGRLRRCCKMQQAEQQPICEGT